jgi:hypothetical protein
MFQKWTIEISSSLTYTNKGNALGRYNNFKHRQQQVMANRDLSWGCTATMYFNCSN